MVWRAERLGAESGLSREGAGAGGLGTLGFMSGKECVSYLPPTPDADPCLCDPFLQ